MGWWLLALQAGGLEGQHGEPLNALASDEGLGARTPAPDFAAGSWEEAPNLILLEAGLSGQTLGQVMDGHRAQCLTLSTRSELWAAGSCQ